MSLGTRGEKLRYDHLKNIIGRTIIYVLRIIIFPISFIPLVSELIIRLFKKDWEVNPFILTGYFLFLAVFSSWAILYMNKIWWWVGLYIMTTMLFEALWKCCLIWLGRPAVMYPNIKIFKSEIKHTVKGRILLTPTALYMGVLSYGFTIYYFAFVNLLLFRVAPIGSFKGISCSDGIDLLVQFIYYSAVTITTLGYGDICPISKTARVITLFELAFGIFFVVFLFGVFISYRSYAK